MQNISGLFQQKNIFSSLDKFEIKDDMRYVTKGPDILYFDALSIEDTKLYLIPRSFDLNETD